MTFYGNKKRLKVFKLSGYLASLVTFLIACQLNMKQASLKANLMLLISFIIFFMIYLISKKYTSGVLSTDEEGIYFQAGLRKITIKWEDIDTIASSELKGQKFTGINLKTTDSLPGKLGDFFTYNQKITGFHICFKQTIFQEDIDEITEFLREQSQNRSAGKNRGKMNRKE